MVIYASQLFIGIYKDVSLRKGIADMIERCEVCQKYQDKQPSEQITKSPYRALHGIPLSQREKDTERLERAKKAELIQ